MTPSERLRPPKGGGGSDYSVAGGGVMIHDRSTPPDLEGPEPATVEDDRHDDTRSFASAYVSQLWAEDWDSPEDSVYDSW
jgi:hypothetical protein